MLAFLFGCESKEEPGTIAPPVAAPEEEVVDTESYYIEDDIDDPLYWVTNEYMQAFMQEVKYRDNDYNYTSILDYDGGGPVRLISRLQSHWSGRISSPTRSFS